MIKTTLQHLLLRQHLRRLRRLCKRHFKRSLGPGHGPAHWDRVARFGKILAVADPEVDPIVVEAFAYIHDVERRNNGDDPEHGPRATIFAESVRHTALSFLDDSQIALLKEACMLHTRSLRTDCPTVNACFDADRIDLLRAGIMPDPSRMASHFGAAFVAAEDFPEVWYRAGGRVVG